MIEKNESIVVCGTGFFFNVFKEYLLSEVLERLDSCIDNIEWENAIYLHFFNNSTLVVFDVEKENELEAFIKMSEQCNVDLMLLLEPELGFLKEQYNMKLLPIVLEKPRCRIQIVRAG